MFQVKDQPFCRSLIAIKRHTKRVKDNLLNLLQGNNQLIQLSQLTLMVNQVAMECTLKTHLDTVRHNQVMLTELIQLKIQAMLNQNLLIQLKEVTEVKCQIILMLEGD